MGQSKPSEQQIQNEIDEIHDLLMQGATDNYIMHGRKDSAGNPIIIERRTYYRRKKKLIQQVSKMWEKKRENNYLYSIQVCQERLADIMNTARAQFGRDGNPGNGVLASELAVSILKLEVEGTLSSKYGRFNKLAQPDGDKQLPLSAPSLPAGESPSSDTEPEQQANGERQF